MKRFKQFSKIRRALIERYLENLEGIKELVLPDDSKKPDWLAFPILIKKNRDKLMKYLEDNNIQSRVAFSGNITRHPAYRDYFKPFDNSDTIMKQGLLVGIHQGLELEDIKYVCDVIKTFFK